MITGANIVYLPWELALEPQQGLVRVEIDYWWEVHPDKGLVFFRRRPRDVPTPQLNKVKEITAKVAEVKDPALGHVVQFVPRAYIPQRLTYYRDNAEVVTDLRGKGTA